MERLSKLAKPAKASAKVTKATKAAEDWTEAALSLLAQQGVDAVKVERLATALGVTKGSFYWHFRDREALLDALLVRWQASSTQAVIERVDAVGGSPAERLTTLIISSSQSKSTSHSMHAARVELAIRGWAAKDKRARQVLQTIDAKRESYVQALLVEHGLSKAQARSRARMLYLALIGEYAFISHGGAASGEEPWRELVALVLTDAEK